MAGMGLLKVDEGMQEQEDGVTSVNGILFRWPSLPSPPVVHALWGSLSSVLTRLVLQPPWGSKY